ncbi:hypothetical protein FN846DRAFT_1019840 [Sphaerosporella brunnea]|uniref:Uncharacterized protein n=1 Tax=Sphaerosporella brunnea TaxID=1250544 RepID=A0A5J5F4D1_9PEZI|nr:hypothetical protein FN846DRAFT_1019840 [Sphaerosporella brunnea]
MIGGNDLEAQRLKTAVLGIQDHQKRSQDEVIKEALSVPLYRPNRYPKASIYYPRCNEKSIPALDHLELLGMTRKTKYLDCAFYYGGVGDARHFYQQLHHIYTYHKEMTERDEIDKRLTKKLDSFLFTLVDMHPKMLARNVMMFRLLHDLRKEKEDVEFKEKEEMIDKEERGEMPHVGEYTFVQATIWYLFACDIMPPYIYLRLLALINKLLASGDNFGIPWLKMTNETQLGIRTALMEWLESHEILTKRFDVHYAQTELKWDKKLNMLQNCEKISFMYMDREWEQYSESLLTYPPPLLIREFEPELGKLISESMIKSPRRRKEAFTKYARDNWRVNFTLLQRTDWYNTRGNDWKTTVDVLKIVDDLLDNTSAFLDEEVFASTMFSLDAPIYISQVWGPFFRSCSDALSFPLVEVTVELVLDEAYHYLDVCRFGIGREPLGYNAIYLSNIPDFTGGFLPTVLHALPMVGRSGYVQSNILWNTQVFQEGLPRALMEYTGTISLETAESLLGFTRLETDQDRWLEYLLVKDGNPLWKALERPHHWILSTPKDLPKMKQFTTWLMYMFLKLALPPPRNAGPGGCAVEQPLTLNTFVRLCLSLVTIRGIPMNWVSDAVDEILTGKITTFARPPLAVPMALDAAHPFSGKTKRPMTFYVEPLLPDLRALLVRYLPALGFRLETPLPMMSSVSKYAIRFLVKEARYSMAKMLMLVFMETRGHLPVEEVWGTMVNGGELDNIYIFSTFEYDIIGDPNRNPLLVRATIHMEKRLMCRMEKCDWIVHLVETDEYTSVSEANISRRELL